MDSIIFSVHITLRSVGLKLRMTRILFFIYFILPVISSWAQCTNSFSLGNDTSICINEVLNLSIPSTYDSYLWQDNSTNSNFTVSSPGIFYAAAEEEVGFNLVSNGNFELGNSFFTTDYTYYPVADVFGPQASYGITSNPNSWFNPFDACNDHSTGSGLMMVIDGSAFNGGNDAIWCQQINVQAGSKYRFSYWIQSVTSSNILANIQVRINGQVQATNLAPLGSCLWEERELFWTSPVSGSVEFCLYDLELAANGNDFALDDISLKRVCEYSDTIEVSLNEIDTIVNPLEICNGDSIFLNGSWRTQAGSYFELNSVTGCSDIIENQLAVLDLDTNSVLEQICVGDSILFGGEYFFNQGRYYQTIPGTFCPVVQELILETSPLPDANAGPDLQYAIDEQAQLSTPEGTNTNYYWSSNYGFSDSSSSISFQVLHPAEEFYLEVFDGLCSNFDTVQVFGISVDLDILVPNAFSPNLDGVNDVFRVVNSDEFLSIELSIYNRWGERIFYGMDENAKWWGNYKNNVECPLGVYTYFIRANAFGYNEGFVSSGTLNLIR